MVSDLNLHRRVFWSFFADQLPDLYARTERGNESTRWLAVGPVPLIVAHYISGDAVGIFVRGARGTKTGHVREFLFPHRTFLMQALQRPELRLSYNFLLVSRLRADMRDEANWPRATAWFADNSPAYQSALVDLQRRP
jgi:hypothetical protein